MIKLRDYQEEIINMIPESGRYIISLATGLGKTVVFSQLPRKGQMLILSHREELVDQPVKYFANCKVGIERAERKTIGDEDIISASVQTIIRRIDKYDPCQFDIIVVDECHHSSATTYTTILGYFKPRLLLGFTATPKRNDGVKLCHVYDKILIYRDLLWGIQNNWLSDIKALKINVKYDLSGVNTALGDYVESQLSSALIGTSKAIAEAYKTHAKGATLIFGASVEHCLEIAKYIDNAVVVTAKTKNRSEIINRFTKREIPCLINCMIFTEGTDIPLVETIINARPTKNISLYTQIVGRGVRKHPDKKYLLLIDICGVSSFGECQAPSLFGFDPAFLPETKNEKSIEEMTKIIIEESEKPEAIIQSYERLSLWAKKEKYNLRDINFFRTPKGDFVVNLGKGANYKIPSPSVIGKVYYKDDERNFQDEVDRLRSLLEEKHKDKAYIWDMKKVKGWKNQTTSKKQKQLLNRLRVDISELKNINKFQASLLINHKILK